MYVRTLYTSHIVFIIPCVLCSYNKLAHVRNYVRVNIMEVPEYKNRMEKMQWKSAEWTNRMEMVEMVGCNGWPFWASLGSKQFARMYNYCTLQ